MIKFCPMCGQKIAPDSRFCNGCGLNLVEYQKKLNKLAATVSADKNKPAQQEQAPVVAPVKADDMTEVKKQSATPVQSQAIVSHKNKPPQLVTTVEDSLVAEEFVERGFFAAKSKCYKEAVQYYAQAIKLGNTEAMYRLGEMYRSGNGVEQNIDKAMAWYFKTATFENTYAMYAVLMLAKIFELQAALAGDDKTKKVSSEGTAKSCFLCAAVFGNPDAMSALGKIFIKEKNFLQARRWLEDAIYFGKVGSLNDLGRLYENGDGVEQNIPKAFQCYQRLAKDSDKYARLFGRLWAAKEIAEVQMRSQAEASGYSMPYNFQLGEHVLSYAESYEKISKFMSNFLHKLFEVMQKFKGEIKPGGKLSSYDIQTLYNYGRSLLEELANEGIKVYSKRGNYKITAKQVVNSNGKDLHGVNAIVKEVFSKTKSPIDIWSKYYDFQGAVLSIKFRFLVMFGYPELFFNEEEAERILEKLEQSHLPEDKFAGALSSVLSKNPYNLKAYEIYLKRYGDERCELRNLAWFFRIENDVNDLKKVIFRERLESYSHEFKLFRSYKCGDDLRGKLIFPNSDIPTYSDLKRDYRILDTEALKLQLNLYGGDFISYFAFVYRMLLRAFEDEKAVAHDSKRIHAFEYFMKKIWAKSSYPKA